MVLISEEQFDVSMCVHGYVCAGVSVCAPGESPRSGRRAGPPLSLTACPMTRHYGHDADHRAGAHLG